MKPRKTTPATRAKMTSNLSPRAWSIVLAPPFWVRDATGRCGGWVPFDDNDKFESPIFALPYDGAGGSDARLVGIGGAGGTMSRMPLRYGEHVLAARMARAAEKGHD